METEMIKALKGEIKSKQLLLKAMKADEKARSKKLFAETKLGKACLKSTATVTNPFARANERAKRLLENPRLVYFDDCLQEAQLVASKAEKIQKEDKRATAAANRCAKAFIELSTIAEENELFSKAAAETLDFLEEHIKRLRPPADPERFAVLSAQLEAAVPQI